MPAATAITAAAITTPSELNGSRTPQTSPSSPKTLNPTGPAHGPGQRQAAEPRPEEERDHHDRDHQHGLVGRTEGLDGETHGSTRGPVDDLVAHPADE